MLRFITYALPALLLLLALFGFAVELFDAEPRQGSVIRLALFDTPLIPAPVVLGAWLMEASGLLALFLLARGRCGAWWLDGLVAGWLAWVFRGPLLVITIVVAARQPQHPWWTLAFGWWVLYSISGLFLAHLARRMDLEESHPEEDDPEEGDPEEGGPEKVAATLDSTETVDNDLEEPAPGAVDAEDLAPQDEREAPAEPEASPHHDSEEEHSTTQGEPVEVEHSNAVAEDAVAEDAVAEDAADEDTVDLPVSGESPADRTAEEK